MNPTNDNRKPYKYHVGDEIAFGRFGAGEGPYTETETKGTWRSASGDEFELSPCLQPLRIDGDHLICKWVQ